MRTRVRSLASLSVACSTVLTVGALVAAPMAAATPRCSNTTPTTTVCETGGSTQIVTSPPVVSRPNFGFPYYGYGFGGLFIGI